MRARFAQLLVAVLLLAATPPSALADLTASEMAGDGLGADVFAGPVGGPTVEPPSVEFTYLGTIRRGRLPVTVRWASAVPDSAPVSGYRLERSLDGGAWSGAPLPSLLALSVKVRLQPWAVVRFRLQATDLAGNVGPWATTEPHWLRATQESVPAITFTSAWQMVSDSSAYRGARATTTDGRETGTFTFTGRQVAWLSARGPDGGEADVYLDGGLAARVNLYNATLVPRSVVFRSAWPIDGLHTIQIRTSNGQSLQVDVDAMATISEPTTGVLVGAGDIASCTYARDSQTAALVSDVLAEDASARAFTVGDNVYPDGSTQYFTNCYEPTWGAFKASTWPVVGNHEYYNNPGAAPYFEYFGANAGEAGQGWYRYESGTWRVYALTSECAPGTACYDAQLTWLKADLAAEAHRCVMAMWHRPLFSTGEHGNSNRMLDVFKVLYDAGAEIVIAGHDHGYQRFAPADAIGTPDAARGVRGFVVGTGGASLYDFPSDSTLIEARDNTTSGVLRLDLTPGGYSWQFLPIPLPTAFTDSGSGTCH